MNSKLSFHYIACLMLLYVICNIAMYYMQYGVSALVILRFLPSWGYVMMVGNFLITLALLSVVFLKKYYKDNHIPCISLFNVIMCFFIGISILAGLLTQGEAIKTMLFYDRKDTFMDYFNSIQYLGKPYEYKVIYPPLINCFYAICGSMTPLSGTVVASASYLREQQMSWIVFYGVTVLSILGISSFVWLFLDKEKIENKIMFLVCVFFSLPFLFLIERGNSLLYVLLFMLAFLYWYNDRRRIFRFVAYVSLGIATGIKITPFIFALLIFRRRKWFEGCVAIIIIAIMFYVPFFFLDGDLTILINNIRYAVSLFQGSVVDGTGTIKMLGNGIYVNLWNTFDIIGRLLNINLWNTYKMLSVLIVFGVSSMVLIADKVAEWKIVALLSIVIILIPGFSIIYCLCYMIFPLVLFMRNDIGERNRINYVYIILFICIFAPLINFRFAIFEPFVEDGYLVRLSTIIESVAVLIMLILLSANALQTLNKKIRMRVLGTGLLVSIVYMLVIVNSSKAVGAFVLGDMGVVNASERLLLENGRYCGIAYDGRVSLQSKDLKKYGLIVAADEGCAGKYVNLYLNGNKVMSHFIDQESWYIYIPAEQIQALDLSDTVDVNLSYEGLKIPVRLSYIGKPRLKDVLKPGMYIDDISEGVWRKTGEATLRMGKSARVLLPGDVAQNGLLFRYNVPDSLLVQNSNENIELEFYIEDRKIKSVPISTAGAHVVVLQPSDLEINGEFPYALNLTIKSNAVYRESDDDESLDSREQSIELLSIGNVDAEPDIWSHYLKGYEKLFLSADDLKEKGFCLTYYISPSKLQNLNKSDLQIKVIIDGEVVTRKSLNNGNSLDGVYLPQEMFSSRESIVSAEIQLEQKGRIPWETLFNDPELVKVLYIGANKIDSDYEMSGNGNIYAANTMMEGIYQDPKDKKMYLGQKGTVLFLKKDMIGHDFVIDYDVPRFLINDSDTNLIVKLNGFIIKEDILDKEGPAEFRISSEQLKMVLAGDRREVVPVHLVVNKVFDPNVLHIFGIGGGEKSIVLNRIYLD